MKRTAFFAIVLLAATTALSQDFQQDQQIQRFKGEPSYAAFRIGAWFPADVEKSFRLDEVSTENTRSRIEQSQAIGIDFHYQHLLGQPLYLDFNVSAWYSTYEFSSLEELSVGAIENADSWAIIFPATLGLSFHPLSRSTMQPYVMAGGGAYFAISNSELMFFETVRTRDEDQSDVAFGWFVGGGFDLLFSPTFGASLAARYQNVEFDRDLLTQQKDFSGLQISLGFVVATDF
ncbi:MAG: hypothetical protein CL946_10460 [Ectothiorhodospiraceae bacterium]|nr:hypothetical protein [Ectothiorhodospiraceae bacterium]